MADFKGSILELNGNKAIVMTENCDFVTVKRQPDMVMGQERRLQDLDLYKEKKNYIKYIALAASVCIVLFSYFMFSQVYMPGTVFAYVDIDINPSIELTVDKNIQVIETKPLNEDAKKLLDELKLKKLPLKQAVAEVVKESEKLGYIKADKGNAILVSAALAKEDKAGSDEEKKLNSVLDDIDKKTMDFDNKEVETEVVKVTPENREQAVKNNISMGRYSLYNKIKQDDGALTIEEAKVSRVYDMLEKIHEKDKGDTKIKNGNDEIKPGKPESNIENNNSADKGNNPKDKADKYKEEKDDKQNKQNQQNKGSSNNTGGNSSPGPKDNPGAARNERNHGKSNDEKSGKVDTGQSADDDKGLADKNVKPAETIDKTKPVPTNSPEQPANNSEDKDKRGTSQRQEDGNNGKSGNNDKGNKASDAPGSQNDKDKGNDNGKNNKK